MTMTMPMTITITITNTITITTSMTMKNTETEVIAAVLMHFLMAVIKIGLGMALSSAMHMAPGIKSWSAKSNRSSFRRSSWQGCVLGFWRFSLYELHVYFSM
jgi:hypothetical protein